MKKVLLTGLAVISILTVGYAISSTRQKVAVPITTMKANKVDNSAAAVKAKKVLAPIESAKGEKTLETIITQADMDVLYTSVAQLEEKADLIVRGRAVSIDYIDWNTVEYTKVSLEVQKSFGSGAIKGDTITIIEPGGITTKAAIIRGNNFKFGEKITPEDEKTKVQVLLEGAPLTEVGDEATYFLSSPGTWPIVSAEYRVPLGSYQGKFKITGGTAKRFVPRDDEGSKYGSLSQSVSDLDAEIEAAPKK